MSEPACATRDSVGVELNSELDSEISLVFDRCFGTDYRTCLVGGAAEPLYEPAQSGAGAHRIFYRYDYPRSALHESAHWCIAGERRRQQLDYGYWYQPDGRDAAAQVLFERVEARPQALEWFFCQAVGLPFQVSIDNLDGDPVDPFPFSLAVWQQARRYLAEGLPPRPQRFYAALRQHFGTASARTVDFDLGSLLL